MQNQVAGIILVFSLEACIHHIRFSGGTSLAWYPSCRITSNALGVLMPGSDLSCISK